MSSRILIVDDEESIRFTFEAFLQDEGHEVASAADLKGGLSNLELGGFDLVFLDILLGRDSGLDILKICREKYPNLPVVMITGSPEIETAAEAVRLGAFDYIPKPVRQDTLLRVTKMALQYKWLIDQKERYRVHLDAIFRSVQEGIITLRVSDNGNGLPADTGGGYGLRGIRERAAQLGGELKLETRQGGGAQVSLWLPI